MSVVECGEPGCCDGTCPFVLRVEDAPLTPVDDHATLDRAADGIEAYFGDECVEYQLVVQWLRDRALFARMVANHDTVCQSFMCVAGCPMDDGS